jgi:hypothetical protein
MLGIPTRSVTDIVVQKPKRPKPSLETLPTTSNLVDTPPIAGQSQAASQPGRSRAGQPTTRMKQCAQVTMSPSQCQEPCTSQLPHSLSMQAASATRKRRKIYDGVASKLYNPVSAPLVNINLPSMMCPYMESLEWRSRPQFSQLWDLKFNSDLTVVDSKFGAVQKGSVLSYQQANTLIENGDLITDHKVPHLPSFTFPDLSDCVSGFLPLNFDLAGKYNSLYVSDAQSKEYELQTRTQSESVEWHNLRKNRITASNFKRVCSRQANFDALSMQLHTSRRVVTAAMRHGLEREPVAAEQYAQIFGRNVYRVGFCINPSCCFLGCSPDRRVYDCDEHENPWGLLEIKCTEQLTVTACKYLVPTADTAGHLKIRKSHEYYYQVMGQMGLTGSAWCDFFVFAKDDFHCERIHFDEVMFSQMLSELTHFFFAYFILQN